MTAAVELTPGAVAVGLGVIVGGFVLWRASKAAGAAAGAVVDAVGTAAQAVNPLNHDNIFAGAVNAVGGAIASDTGPGRNADGSWTLGGWIFDMTNPDIYSQVKDINKPVFTGGATGSW